MGNRIAITFACTTLDDQTRITHSLSTTCWGEAHVAHILTVIVPAMLLYLCFIPGYIVWFLVRLRDDCQLYSGDDFYQPHWTTRFGFLFAGYEPQYVWWEMVVLLRKAIFVVMTIFVRSQGPVAQVIAAVLVLVVALSLQLRYTPYEEDDHDRLESASLHASTICLPLVLLMNEFSKNSNVGRKGEKSKLGLLPSIVVVICVLGFTVVFFGIFMHAVVRGSQEHPGALGNLSRKLYPDHHKVVSEKKRIRNQMRKKSRMKHSKEASSRHLNIVPTNVMEEVMEEEVDNEGGRGQKMKTMKHNKQKKQKKKKSTVVEPERFPFPEDDNQVKMTPGNLKSWLPEN